MNSDQESVDKAVEHLNKDKQLNNRMLHPNTFDYLKPTDNQISDMNTCRAASQKYSQMLENMLPNGPDKTYAIRKLREVAMWANIAITRNADGSPRS